MLHKSLRSMGIRFKNPCEFWSGLGRGSGGPLGETKVWSCRVGGTGVHPMAKPGPWPAAATPGRCPTRGDAHAADPLLGGPAGVFVG